MNDLTAAVIAGGLGTRLRAVVADRPTVLAEVRGRPFIAYLLDQLAAAGVRRAVLCTGHLGEQVAARLGRAHGALALEYSREETPLGTAGALRLALPRLGSDPVLAVNGDSFCDADLGAFWRWHRDQRAPASMLLAEVPDTRRFGRVTTAPGGAVAALVEKGEAPGRGWINAGVYLLSDRVLRAIPPDRAVSLEREVLPAWIGKGLRGFCAAGAFLDIGTPESYAEAERFFAGGGAPERR